MVILLFFVLKDEISIPVLFRQRNEVTFVRQGRRKPLLKTTFAEVSVTYIHTYYSVERKRVALCTPSSSLSEQVILTLPHGNLHISRYSVKIQYRS